MNTQQNISPQVNQPKLRFPEFSEEWLEKKYGEFLRIELREEKKPADPYTSIGIRSHFKGTFQRLDSDPEKNSMETLFLVQEDDLIANITFAWEGAIAIAKKSDAGGLVSHRFPTYVFDSKITNPRYFQFVFPTKRNKYLLGTISPGGAGRNRVLNRKDFLKLKVLIPSLPEQQKISSFLSAVNEWIENLRKQKEELEQYKRGMMQQIFSQNVRFKDENEKAYPKWNTKKLQEVAQVVMGQSPESDSYNDSGKGIYLIQGNADIRNRRSNPRNWTTKPTKLCRVGDILLTVRAPVGAIAKAVHAACIGRGVCSIRNNKSSVINFLYQWLLSFDGRWVRYEQGSTFTAINTNDILKLRIIVPSIEEQRKIGEFLGMFDYLIESKELQIERAEVWKKGLLQALFV